MPLSLTMESKPSKSTTKVIGFVFLLILQATTTFAALYSHVGCFKDKEYRALPERLSRSISSVDQCYQLVKNMGYQAFGVQYRIECWTGNNSIRTYNTYGRATNCRNGRGGAWSNDVYIIAPTAPPQNVTVVSVTYFSVLLKWLPPPDENGNDRILQYSVTALQNVTLSNGTVLESPSVFRNFSHNDISSEQQGVLEGLQEDTNYKIVIIANNGGGNSPSSSPVFFKTLEAQIFILCEHWSDHITCGSGTHIHVMWANYGRTVGRETCQGDMHTTKCRAASSLSKVRQLCENKTNCSLYASNSVFGDPCSGTKKYLEVHYTCALSAPPQNVTVISVTYFSVLLKWFSPTNEKENGRVLQYTVMAVHNATLSDHSVTEPQSILRTFPHNDTSSEQQGLLEGLQEDTNYKIVITASNRYGSSPSSSPVSFKTLQVKSPTVPSTTQKTTEAKIEDTQSSTQSKETTSISTVSKGEQKDVESGENSNMIVDLVVAAVFLFVAILLLILFVLYRRLGKKGRNSSNKMPEDSLFNNRVTAPPARNLPITQDADLYLAPVDNHKRWEQLQQQPKTGPDRSSYNSEEISKHKQNDLNNMDNLCDDVYSYAAPDNLSLTLNRKEKVKSAQFAQHNPISETAENGESKNVNINSKTLQQPFTAVTDQPYSQKETKPVLAKKHVPAPKRKKTKLPSAEIGVGELPSVEDRSQLEVEYNFLEGPEPSSSLNNVSSILYDEVYSTGSRGRSEREGPVDYDVIWSSNNKPPTDTRSKPKAQKTLIRKAVVDTPDLYDKLWLSGADDELQQKSAQDNIYDYTYATTCNNIH